MNEGDYMDKFILANSHTFIRFLEDWMSSLSSLSLNQAVPLPERTALISIDVTNGFCKKGALADERVASIVTPVVRLLKLGWKHGIRHIVLSQDTHEPEALEFSAYPAHCVRDTDESEAVSEIKSLPFYDQMKILQKNSIAPQIHSGFEEWLKAHPFIETFIVVGDCTDICTYQMAIFLKAEANAYHRQRRVIVPEDCVNTYDRSIATAQSRGGLPHDGDLLHAIFLYHMGLNGIEVVAKFEE
jgi:nicotinamidase-related amidase